MLHTSTQRLLKNVKSATVLELSNTNVRKPQPISNAANNAAHKKPNICQKEIDFFSFLIFF